ITAARPARAAAAPPSPARAPLPSAHPATPVRSRAATRSPARCSRPDRSPDRQPRGCSCTAARKPIFDARGGAVVEDAPWEGSMPRHVLVMLTSAAAIVFANACGSVSTAPDGGGGTAGGGTAATGGAAGATGGSGTAGTGSGGTVATGTAGTGGI